MGFFGRRRRERERAEAAARAGELDAAIRAVEERLPHNRRDGWVMIGLSVLGVIFGVAFASLTILKGFEVQWDLGAWVDAGSRFGTGGGPLWLVVLAFGLCSVILLGGAVATLARPFRQLRQSEDVLSRFRAERAALTEASDRRPDQNG